MSVLLIFTGSLFHSLMKHTLKDLSYVVLCVCTSRSMDLILDLRNLNYPPKFVGASPFNISHISLCTLLYWRIKPFNFLFTAFSKSCTFLLILNIFYLSSRLIFFPLIWRLSRIRGSSTLRCHTSASHYSASWKMKNF